MATHSDGIVKGERGRRVLVVSALGREMAPLRRETDSRIALLETGEGIENAERALRLWLNAETPRAVLGIGFAGALSPALGVCDLIVARECRMAGSETVTLTQTLLETARRSQGAAKAVRFGVTVTVNEIVCLAEEKQRLASTLGADENACVDMESSAVARVCSERGVPFLIVRCVTDLFSEDLPVDFNKCRQADGRISTWKVLGLAVRRPSSIKTLWELRRRSILCSEKLARFVRGFMAEID